MLTPLDYHQSKYQAPDISIIYYFTICCVRILVLRNMKILAFMHGCTSRGCLDSQLRSLRAHAVTDTHTIACRSTTPALGFPSIKCPNLGHMPRFALALPRFVQSASSPRKMHSVMLTARASHYMCTRETNTLRALQDILASARELSRVA